MEIKKQESMIKYSKILSKPLGYNIDYICSDVLSSKVEKLQSFDLVIESFMLNELTDKEVVDEYKNILLQPITTNDLSTFTNSNKLIKTPQNLKSLQQKQLPMKSIK